MNKFFLMAGVAASLLFATAANADTTITKTISQAPDGSTTTTITRATDTDSRAAKVRSPGDFTTYAYSRWDRNGDGYITPDEWNADVTQWYGPTNTSYKTYADWDKNHNGKLDAQEFDRVLNDTHLYDSWNVQTETVTTPGLTPDASFATYDLNGDGSITPSEWAQTHK